MASLYFGAVSTGDCRNFVGIEDSTFEGHMTRGQGNVAKTVSIAHAPTSKHPGAALAARRDSTILAPLLRPAATLTSPDASPPVRTWPLGRRGVFPP